MSDPQRRCIATGQIREKEDLLRFALSPDGQLVHDIQQDLPGRGIWISCDQEAIQLAQKKGLFGKSAKRAVTVPENLLKDVEKGLRQRSLSLLGLGRKSGLVTVGFSKVENALKSGKVAVLLAASDGAEDGRKKLKRIAGDLPVVELFSNAELSQSLGRENVVHASIGPGGLTNKLMVAVSRLTKFRTVNHVS